MKKLIAIFKRGLITIIPLLIIFFLTKWLWDLLSGFTWPFCDNKIVSAFFNLAIFASLICVIGWLLGFQWLRKFLKSILEKIPFVSLIAKFVFDQDDSSINNNKLTSSAYLFEITPGCWIYCFIVKEWTICNDRGENIVWCRICVPSSPIPATGYLMEVEKSRLKPMNRTVQELFLTIMSFGFK